MKHFMFTWNVRIEKNTWFWDQSINIPVVIKEKINNR